GRRPRYGSRPLQRCWPIRRGVRREDLLTPGEAIKRLEEPKPGRAALGLAVAAAPVSSKGLGRSRRAGDHPASGATRWYDRWLNPIPSPRPDLSLCVTGPWTGCGTYCFPST